MSERITERNEINEYIESIILKHRSTVTKEEWDERKQENTQNLFNNSTLSLCYTLAFSTIKGTEAMMKRDEKEEEESTIHF